MSTFLLKLYIAGRTPCSRRAISHLRALCANQLGGTYQLDVIDVLERPELAEQWKVLATPTVIRESSPKERRVVGDLSDPMRVLNGLGLQQGGTENDTVDGQTG